LREVMAKHALGRSSIADYTVNPYLGCQHNCLYCYARAYTDRLTRGDLLVRVNVPDLLVREVVKKRRGLVYLSSLTDPYQPIETKYKLTREILEVLHRYNWPVTLQTKSPLVLRDLRLLQRMRAEVGITVSPMDSRLEPNAPPLEERISALQRLVGRVRTFAFIGPIIPGTPIDELKYVLEEVREVDLVYLDKLNLRPGVFERVNPILSEIFPGWKKEMKHYYDAVLGEVVPEMRRLGIRYKVLFR